MTAAKQISALHKSCMACKLMNTPRLSKQVQWLEFAFCLKAIFDWGSHDQTQTRVHTRSRRLSRDYSHVLLVLSVKWCHVQASSAKLVLQRSDCEGSSLLVFLVVASCCDIMASIHCVAGRKVCSGWVYASKGLSAVADGV